MTTVAEDHIQTRIDGLLGVLREAEADFRRSYARVLDVVAELDAEKAGAVTGFGTTARLLVRVLNLTKSEARTCTEQAQLLTPRQSLTGQPLPPALPTTAAELAAGAIGPAQVRVITATMRQIPPTTHPDTRTGRADPRARRSPVRPRRAGPHRRAPACASGSRRRSGWRVRTGSNSP